MAGNGLSGILGGALSGFKKGLAYDAAFLRAFVWAIEQGEEDAAGELVEIAKANAAEMVDETGNVLPHVVEALLEGHDPFTGSRHLFQAWQQKWGVH